MAGGGPEPDQTGIVADSDAESDQATRLDRRDLAGLADSVQHERDDLLRQRERDDLPRPAGNGAGAFGTAHHAGEDGFDDGEDPFDQSHDPDGPAANPRDPQVPRFDLYV